MGWEVASWELEDSELQNSKMEGGELESEARRQEVVEWLPSWKEVMSYFLDRIGLQVTRTDCDIFYNKDPSDTKRIKIEVSQKNKIWMYFLIIIFCFFTLKSITNVKID